MKAQTVRSHSQCLNRARPCRWRLSFGNVGESICRLSPGYAVRDRSEEREVGVVQSSERSFQDVIIQLHHTHVLHMVYDSICKQNGEYVNDQGQEHHGPEQSFHGSQKGLHQGSQTPEEFHHAEYPHDLFRHANACAICGARASCS